MGTPKVQSIYISDSVQESLTATAEKLQAYYDENDSKHYSIENLQKALVIWLETSIEQLVDNALFHVVEGTEAYSFNRVAFELAMKSHQRKN